MYPRRRLWQTIGLAALIAVAGFATPARAHWRGGVIIGVPGPVFGGGFYPGFYAPPIYSPYPCHYPAGYPMYPPAYTLPGRASYPPPGWVPGHWERRTNRWGRTVEVWIPPYLQ